MLWAVFQGAMDVGRGHTYRGRGVQIGLVGGDRVGEAEDEAGAATGDRHRAGPFMDPHPAHPAPLAQLPERPLDAAEACFDVVFPVLHGPGGEDGTVQALLELAAAPFVGAGTTASAIAMDKLALKLLCAGAGIAQTDFLAADDADAEELVARINATFGFPCFVKPANLGSSVGISRVSAPGELAAALGEARRWDRRVLIERAVDAREIELAMLGNDVPEVSPPGEIVSRRGFYDYTSKYVDTDDATLIAPANVDPEALATMRSIAVDVWKRIGCRGMARADFFLERGTGRVLFNELNTIPGMTSISMFPKLWELAGLRAPALMRRLVELALEAHAGAALPDARSRRA